MASRSVLSLVSIGLVIAACLTSRAASAQPLAGDRAVELATQGQAAYERGDWNEAFLKFQAADAIVAAPTFRLYMARAQKNQGKLIGARATYRALVEMKLGADAPGAWASAQSDARAEVRDVESAIPTIKIHLSNAAVGASVTLDQAPAALDTAIEVDPGSHTAIVVGTSVAKLFDVTPGKKDTVIEIDLASKSAGGPGVGPGGLLPPPGVGGSSPDETSSSSALLPVGGVFLGLGGASLIVGIATGAAALAMDDDVNPEDPSFKDDQDALIALADASTATFIIGGALAATGLVLVIVGVTSEDDGEAGASPRPVISLEVGPSKVGLSGTF